MQCFEVTALRRKLKNSGLLSRQGQTEFSFFISVIKMLFYYHTSSLTSLYLLKQNVLQGKWYSKSTVQIDLIHNTSHLCARARIDVTWFLRGQTSEIICQFKKSRSSCLFQTAKSEQTFTLKTIMASYGQKRSLLLFWKQSSRCPHSMQ